MTAIPSLSQRADALEEREMRALGERIVTKSLLYHLADGERTLGSGFGAGERLLMGEDPRLPPMPDAPTLFDFFRLRLAPAQQHLLQSAMYIIEQWVPNLIAHSLLPVHPPWKEFTNKHVKPVLW